LTTAFLNRIRDALAGQALDRTRGDLAPEIALTGEAHSRPAST
jgi:hypothetical protein